MLSETTTLATALTIASEDIYTTVDDLASAALRAGRISDGERARAGNPKDQRHIGMVARAEFTDLLWLLKAAAERLGQLADEENAE